MAEKDILIEEKTKEANETHIEDVVLETEGGAKSILGATNSTGDIAATSLDTKTTPADTDSLILFNQNTNVGYQIDYDNLADAILSKITSKTYANQVGGSSAATLLAQLSTLNSKTAYNKVLHNRLFAMSDNAKKYEYTGISFQSQKDCILVVTGSYNASPVNNIGIGTDKTNQYSFIAHSETTVNAGNTLFVFLPNYTTYYLWAGSVSAGNMRFDAYIIGDGGTVTVT